MTLKRELRATFTNGTTYCVGAYRVGEEHEAERVAFEWLAKDNVESVELTAPQDRIGGYR